MRNTLYVLLATLFLFTFSLVPHDVKAMQKFLSFDEIVRKADVIFMGKVIDQKSRPADNQRVIFTDVQFEVKKFIFKNEKSPPHAGDTMQLTFVGGEMEGKIVRISDVPSFETGSTYLVFSRMDKNTYASPIIGAYQGLFAVITDEASGISYPLTYGKRPVLGIADGDLIAGPPVKRIHAGKAEGLSEKVAPRLYEIAPRSADGTGRAKAEVSLMKSKSSGPMMNLDQFVTEITERIRVPKNGN